MKIFTDQGRLMLLALVAFSMSKAEVSAGVLAGRTSPGDPATLAAQ
jgi:hypothetical protein